jgi:hypothetical protein
MQAMPSYMLRYPEDEKELFEKAKRLAKSRRQSLAVLIRELLEKEVKQAEQTK